MPLITGDAAKSKRVQKQTDIQGVIKDAAMVFASALLSPTPPPPTTKRPHASDPSQHGHKGLPTGLSPGTHASLRRSQYQDLGTLKELYENSVLSSDEFEEQKQSILGELRKVSNIRCHHGLSLQHHCLHVYHKRTILCLHILLYSWPAYMMIM